MKVVDRPEGEDRSGDGTANPRRWPKRMAVGTATVAGVALAATAAGGWYYADELLLVSDDPPEYPVRVVAVNESSITLAGEGADQPGVTGIEWSDGYARVGPEVSTADGNTVRSLQPYPDIPAPDTNVRMDFYAVPDDTAAVSKLTGLDIETVTYDGPLGQYPATFVPAPDDGSERWIVHVHGRGASRAEGYRLLPSVHNAGHPQLAISYRNDDDAPADPDGEFGLGWTESEDLVAAVDYARANGARDVVLVGYSMGGAIVGNYLRTHGSSDVAGVVYDSPALSWPDILASQAADRGLPAFAGRIASTVVRARTGIELDTMDQVEHADRLDVPVLLVHGENDSTVPVESSDTFADARADLVTYLRTDAEHVQSWNVDPERYESAVTDFLTHL